MIKLIVFLLFCSTACYSQTHSNSGSFMTEATIANSSLSERVGNFSIELLYHTSALQTSGQNLIISPMTIWTALAVVLEGARGATGTQICDALRQPKNLVSKLRLRKDISDVMRLLNISKMDIIELEQFNGIFIDREKLPDRDFQEAAKTYYGTAVVYLSFDNTDAANHLNMAVANYTNGRVPSIIEKLDLEDTPMVLSSAFFFKGKWTVPFNTTSTRKQPFYDSDRNQIGEVNMMYNRASYNFAEIKVLQAKVVELPIGNENRLSMVIMLPNYGVSLENMFFNFKKQSLDACFKEFKPLIDDFSRNEVELFLPRFKIKTDSDLTKALKRMGIKDMFDTNKARIPYLTRSPDLHASKLIHKAEIEITEEGTAQKEKSDEEFSNRVGVVWFEVSRPFTYMIVDKISNAIILGGVYRQPSLF